MSRGWFEAKFGSLGRVFKELCYNPATMPSPDIDRNQVNTTPATPEQNRDVAIKAAELKVWQRRAEEKLLPFALAAEQAPNHLKAQVYQNVIERTGGRLVIIEVESAVAGAENQSSLRWRQAGLEATKKSHTELVTAIEARKSDTEYQQEFDTLNDLILSIKFAHQEGLKLTDANLDERSRDIAGDRQVLESLRGARRTARTIAQNAAPITEKPEYYSTPRRNPQGK
jgi:hypothetical protein